MAIQIIVSFGHAHRIEGFRQGALLLQATPGIHSQLTVDSGDQTPKPIGLVFDYCAICVVIDMGASAVPVHAPASSVPLVTSKIHFSSHAEAVTRTVGHLLFQARAPPYA
ncbi:MAG TPA: hypothetical protein VLJ17_24245 [Xanthobacteraceae bacterium]|nr:hypothetical protein [Xanthobacteraceae bacterium]